MTTLRASDGDEHGGSKIMSNSARLQHLPDERIAGIATGTVRHGAIP
jgi:hypothetical protein